MRLAKQGGCFVDIACMSESLKLYSIGSQCNCLKRKKHGFGATHLRDNQKVK